jgi:predicted CoA-substrate-specific enzyme activase
MVSSGQQERHIIGVDVGSTTVKAVAVEPWSDEIVWQDYQRHETKLAEKVFEFLSRMEKDIGISKKESRIFFTGSGGNHLAELVGGRFVQEVNAVSLAVENLFPEVYSVIELGGQDSKIVLFKDQPGGDRRKKIATMNDKCAGGTGAVLDKISAKLDVSQEQLSQLKYDGVRIHRVAGKCGVFSETDINSLQKQGIPPDELMASLFEAIVLQNLTVLTRGHTLYPQVLLLGGPNTFLRGLQEAWRAQLPRLWEERNVTPPPGLELDKLIRAPANGHYFGSIGAVHFGKEQESCVGRYSGLQHLEHYLREGHSAKKARFAIRALKSSEDDLSSFLQQYSPEPFTPPAIPTDEAVPAFLGVDGGSTSTKAVLLDEDGELLCKAYRLSRGNPIQDTIELVEELREQIESRGAKIEILGAATTGYAKDVLQKVLRADTALVETVAHARSAIHFYGEPDVIVDVGGQDIKLIILKDGHVKDFMLNTQCSAGNGYFLQATAESFGLEVDQYAETAFGADVMPEFSYGCAVFLQADIVNYQRQGWTSEELLAGLAAVLPKNIWLYVAKIPNLASLGSRFILQGGTQRNLAAVKAQVDYIRSRFKRSSIEPEITVHKHCGEAGAIGASLEARRLWLEGNRTEFIGLDAVGTITYRTTSNENTRCTFCKNGCLRTFVDYKVEGIRPVTEQPADSKVPLKPGEERLIVSTCEKGSVEDLDKLRAILAGMKETKKSNPNLIDIAGRNIWRSFKPALTIDPLPSRAWRRATRRRVRLMQRRDQVRIGVPRVLGMYLYAPFFSAYLESLGVAPRNIVYSDFTNDAMYREGTRRGAIDPCFPAKVVISHLHNLIYKHHQRNPIHYIFLPMFDVLNTPLVNTLGTNACATIIATPQSARAAFTKETDVFAEHNIEYLYPFVDLADRKLLERQMLQTWGGILGLSDEENQRAIDQGFAALESWNSQIRKEAREVIDTLERERRIGVVMLGRSYHHDPGLNHGIFDEFQMRGYPVLSQNSLPLDEDLLERLFGQDVADGLIQHPLDITDVWKHPYIASTSLKIWAAKFTARHPNLVGVEVSNFKCGHDAPLYQVIERIIESAGRPYFSFKDLDENKPTGSFRVRIETIDYFLKRHREELVHREEVLTNIDRQLREYETALHSGLGS